MGDPGKLLLDAALAMNDAPAKALASFLFREVIEDAHTKYDISQEDMKAMCKDAVNRAAMFLRIKDDPGLCRAFAIHAIEGWEWDDPECPDANENGYLEMPVDMVKEMTDAMVATQAYSANVTALNTLKTVSAQGLKISK